jgi:hypothetical protein
MLPVLIPSLSWLIGVTKPLPRHLAFADAINFRLAPAALNQSQTESASRQQVNMAAATSGGFEAWWSAE